jgi:hypothetical protein
MPRVWSFTWNDPDPSANYRKDRGAEHGPDSGQVSQELHLSQLKAPPVVSNAGPISSGSGAAHAGQERGRLLGSNQILANSFPHSLDL